MIRPAWSGRARTSRRAIRRFSESERGVDVPVTRRDVLKNSLRTWGAVAVAAFARAAGAAAPEPSPVTPALIEAARKEGKAVWSAPMDLPVAERMARAFEAKYPGIAVRIERTGSERQFQRLAQEYAAN